MGQHPSALAFSLARLLDLWAGILLLLLSHWLIYWIYGPASCCFGFFIGPFTRFMGRYPSVTAFSLAHLHPLWASILLLLPSHWPIYTLCGPASFSFRYLTGPITSSPALVDQISDDLIITDQSSLSAPIPVGQ